jgi:hypothetical protein
VAVLDTLDARLGEARSALKVLKGTTDFLGSFPYLYLEDIAEIQDSLEVLNRMCNRLDDLAKGLRRLESASSRDVHSN